MRDEKIAKMTETLLAGGKMLSVHCAECMGPLFEFRGKIVCPACGMKPFETTKTEIGSKTISMDRIESVLRTKLSSLTEQLEKETDHTKTLELLDRIKSVLETLGKLKGG